MKLNFCTLFNSGYLARGIALYESLCNVSSNFHLYIFAFDNDCYDFFKSRQYKNITVISLNEFEDEELLKVKPSRTAGEYCWTCTSSTLLFCLKKYNIDHCTYLDADMCFYSNPAVLINEMGDKSVLITEHRFSPEHDHTERSGKYCVQFITIKNNEKGLEVVNWWRNACIEWCFARHEDGKFGDQKYLDDWMTRFDCVHELKHLGGGIAPWNIQQYQFTKKEDKIIGVTETKQTFESVFLHFHGLRFFSNNVTRLIDHGYHIPKSAIKLFFIPYAKRLLQIEQQLKKEGINVNVNAAFDICSVPVSKLAALFYYYQESTKLGKKYYLGKGLLKNLKCHYYFKSSDLLKTS
jgi:hypothetical protein